MSKNASDLHLSTWPAWHSPVPWELRPYSMKRHIRHSYPIPEPDGAISFPILPDYLDATDRVVGWRENPIKIYLGTVFGELSSWAIVGEDNHAP